MAERPEKTMLAGAVEVVKFLTPVVAVTCLGIFVVDAGMELDRRSSDEFLSFTGNILGGTIGAVGAFVAGIHAVRSEQRLRDQKDELARLETARSLESWCVLGRISLERLVALMRVLISEPDKRKLTISKMIQHAEVCGDLPLPDLQTRASNHLPSVVGHLPILQHGASLLQKRLKDFSSTLTQSSVHPAEADRHTLAMTARFVGFVGAIIVTWNRIVLVIPGFPSKELEKFKALMESVTALEAELNPEGNDG